MLVFTLTASLTNILFAFEFVLPNEVSVKGKNEVDFIPKYLEYVRDLDELGCPPIKKSTERFCYFMFQSQQSWTLETNEKFSPCSKIKSMSLYQWLENSKYGNTDGNQSHVSNVNSSFERLHVSSSKQ